MFLARLSVSSRFLIVLAIGFIFQAGISLVSLVHLKQVMLRDRTYEVKHLLETAYSTVVFYHDQAAQGVMTDAAAREAARDTVRAMHTDNNNYFFIWDMNGVGVAEGSHPEWEGKNVLQSPEKEKLPVVSTMVSQLLEVCRSAQKEGVTTYKIPKYGQTEAIEKISYTKLYEPWGWSIGTGAYVDDIDKMFMKQIFSLLWVYILLIVIAGLFTFLIGRDLTHSLTRLTVRMASVAKGELEGGVSETGRRDEVGVIARALLVLRDNSREAVELRLDPLTKLPNRKVLIDRIKAVMAENAVNGRFGGLMLIDMDKFKTLNDTHGHDMGDMLLKEVAKRLVASVGENDLVVRVSGDEFVVLLVDLGDDEKAATEVAEMLSEKTLAAINQPFNLANGSYVNSASIGITLFQGRVVTVSELLKRADLALYKSKEKGRNSCVFFNPEMAKTVLERAKLESDMRRAIEENQFELYYQPQIGLDGNLKGVEALLRWIHPTRGNVSPAEMIPVAEETGLIVSLGQWVLETACRQIALWSKNPNLASVRVAVNVSAHEFQQAEFVDNLIATLEITGADPNRLELELTESVLVENVDKVIEKMVALRRLGVSFSLDDFGTGYSSLAYLKSMPLAHVKIDRSFVRDLLHDPNDAAIANTVVMLAHTLGFEVIAEGIEMIEQLDYLAGCGCKIYQGYYFSRPLPVASFEKYALKIHKSFEIHLAAG